MKSSLCVLVIMTLITITFINGLAIQNIDEKSAASGDAPTDDDSKYLCCCCCGYCYYCGRDAGNNGTVPADDINKMPILKRVDGESWPGKSPKMFPETEATDPKYRCCCCCGWCMFCC